MSLKMNSILLCESNMQRNKSMTEILMKNFPDCNIISTSIFGKAIDETKLNFNEISVILISDELSYRVVHDDRKDVYSYNFFINDYSFFPNRAWELAENLRIIKGFNSKIIYCGSKKIIPSIKEYVFNEIFYDPHLNNMEGIIKSIKNL